MTPPPWTRPLWHALRADRARLAHALLLQGPAGIGKLAFAEAFAQSLLCETPGAEGDACGACNSCHWFEQGGHPDYKRIEPPERQDDEEGGAKEAGKDSGKDGGKDGAPKKGGRQIAIGEIRALGEFLALAAHQGGWRVVVIHPAETMNAAAANALLKTLEEPPADVLIILITHQPRRLLPTIRSRCRKVPLGLPKSGMAVDWLRRQGLADPEALLREAGGAPLLAMQYADPERAARRARFLDALARADGPELSSLAQEFQSRLDEAWGWLMRWTHDLMALRGGAPARYFVEQTAPLARLAEAADPALLLDLEQRLRHAGRWLKHPLNGQLLLESWLSSYAELAATE
jgi:DNA polymerase-3 subunit delta'